jgi:hypothetical protein
MENTQDSATISLKLLAVQEELSPILKDKNNPFFKSKYADINSFIEMVKPVLNKNKLVLLQPLTHLNGTTALETILVDAETGYKISSLTPIALKETDPQKIGSAITYYRRYALQSLLLIQAEDDDGNGSKPQPVVKPVAKVKPTLTQTMVTEQIVPLLNTLDYNTDSKEAIKNGVLALTSLELTADNFKTIVDKLQDLVDDRNDELSGLK